MKSKNISKNMKGQIQTMGKGGIQQMSNINPVQPIQNYNANNYNNNYNNNNYNMNQMYPMNPMNQMYPMNPMNQMNQVNPYPYWNQNNQMNNRNIYENSKKNNMNNPNNNPIVRNAQMIINNNNNNMNNNINKSLKNKKKSQSAKSINNNNNYNNNNYMYNNNNNNMMNNNNRSPQQQLKNIKDYQFMEFHPYTLKDYKELTRNPVVMGPLGANIGTKEWEQKRNKMKKMMNYSNNINKEHKGIRSLKKDTPKDEIEKLTKEKIEKSIRHRTYEYGKLIRTGKYKEDYEEKDFNNFNNNLNIIPENQENEYYNNKPEISNINNNENNNIILNENNNDFIMEENNMKNSNNMNNIEKESEINYGQLLKQNEEYKNKIQDIKDQLLD